MFKHRESSTDKDVHAKDIGYGFPDTLPTDRKRKWVNLAQLDGPLDDALMDGIGFKVRFLHVVIYANRFVKRTLHALIHSI